MKKIIFFCYFVFSLYFIKAQLTYDSGLTFIDIVSQSSALDVPYVRARTPAAFALWDFLSRKNPFTPQERLFRPMWPQGAPGVLMFDFDGDGDDDLYVTNGPNTNNSLYRNDGGNPLSFVDVASSCGAGLFTQDSTGVCSADFDNDGDMDIYVCGRNESDRILKNNGDGTFTDVTNSSGITPFTFNTHPQGCSIADFDNDGFVDIIVANTINWINMQDLIFRNSNPFRPVGREPLLMLGNLGNFTFNNITSPDIHDTKEPTWGILTVDWNFDGHMDTITVHDQAADNPNNLHGLCDVFSNDGTGVLVKQTASLGLAVPGFEGTTGGWMGVTAADYNCDGHMDFFATNFGQYMPIVKNLPGGKRLDSKWFIQNVTNGDRSFIDSKAGNLGATPFGWGCSSPDLNLDGKIDIVFHGNFISTSINGDSTNPGTLLFNDDNCAADFKPDFNALANSGRDHRRREVHGVVTGDLNDDGYPDIVTVSSDDYGPGTVLNPMGVDLNSPFDPIVRRAVIFSPHPDPSLPPPNLILNETFDLHQGSLTIEISDAALTNEYIKVELLGTKGLTTGGKMNRAGIGGNILVTPKDLQTAMQPVIAGSSRASQDSLVKIFGLGSSKKADIEVFWPTGTGGTWNALFGVKDSSRILFPEIPCSFKAFENDFSNYNSCIINALGELLNANKISETQQGDFISSAIVAYNLFHNTNFS